jgi:hypothetical protein
MTPWTTDPLGLVALKFVALAFFMCGVGGFLAVIGD